MAETVVFSVLQKLAEVAIQEARFLYGVKDQVETMKRELIRIQCFLKDADSKRKGDNRIENWVKEVRDVSYWIEDVIDTFLIEIQQIPPRKPGLVNKLKRIGKKSGKVVLLHKVGDQIIEIQKRMTEIVISRETYGIGNLGENSTEPPNRLRRKLVVPNIENDIIGFNDDKAKIMSLLLDQNVLRRRVVSIVGQGGLGKTTLAQKIYNSEDLKNNFGIQIWLTISQEFKPVQLLKYVLSELGGTSQSPIEDESYFVGEIHKLLSNKKYLVVLDDIWNDTVWSDLLPLAFPDNNNGSRVLITTRFLNVAKTADPKGVHELRFLSDEESLQLLLEKAIPREDASECYPPDLYELAKKFVNNFGGLPLALVVVGGLLSIKPPNYGAWHNVLSAMDWQTDGNKCTLIIATSYEDLSLNLKLCFIYLSLFPEDYIIDARLLIRMWVAEGFIPDEAGKIMEDTAESYLEDLAQRCMIQVTRRSIADGSIKCFRVHDLLRDLAIHEANEKNLLQILSERDRCPSTNVSRRATFHLDDYRWKHSIFDDKKLIECTNSNVRTFFFFGKVVPLDPQFKLLRVLFVSGYDHRTNSINPYWWNSLKEMFHLRCLVFTDFTTDACKLVLPIDNLHNLETLEITQSRGYITVPMSVWAIKTLRHVITDVITPIGFGSTPPDFPNLHTLGLRIQTDDTPQIELFNMPHLRHLSLTVSDVSWDPIFNLLVKLDYIVSLKLKAGFLNYDIPLKIIDARAFPSYPHMQNLFLDGVWQLKGAVLTVDMFPPHLTKLKIRGSKIDQDLMPVLELLPSLKELILYGTYGGKKMISSQGGFRQLQCLEFGYARELEEWKIEAGAMPMLDRLKLYRCKEMQMIPDLHHLPTLKTLRIYDLKEEVIKKLQNEERYKIQHIPSVTFKEYDRQI